MDWQYDGPVHFKESEYPYSVCTEDPMHEALKLSAFEVSGMFRIPTRKLTLDRLWWLVLKIL